MTEAVVQALLDRLRKPLPTDAAGAVADEALAACRSLHGRARSSDALPLAQAVLECATREGDRERMFRSIKACGNLSSDTGDVVGAIEYFLQALRMATADENRVEMAGCWNNLGVALGISGNFVLAMRCYQRAVALLEPMANRLFGRFSAWCNLADSCYHLGLIDEGVAHGERALREMSAEFLVQDPHGAVLLRRNLVRVHLAAGNLQEAARHMAEAIAIAEKSPTPRARIAAEITRASYELATGSSDVALTRLDQTLARAREAPATLRDTLACVVRAEESAGNAARALMRLQELSDHIYDLAIERARGHLERAGLREEIAGDQQAEQDRVRLVAKLAPRTQPEGWKTLQRLAVGAVMRIDDTGWHGKRVGALTKVLALASGVPPLQALEMGLAAELHDIGMMSIPEAILAKRGPLNDAERAIVERHADAGAEMLRDDADPLVFQAREIAKYHHAHWDGNGHPERVGGKFIPLGARICAIADAYDAMVCGVGRLPPKDMGAALAELRRQAGRQFDPGLVSCFDSLIMSETKDLGLDLDTGSGMEDFQALISALREDRGFV
ncbi:MAG TPA: HD domain-containing phosphohydrolase [Usitatibacter sp.]|jgi:putative two-component system response regulator|nr:HD domain-containing phosphohydrolase [Usitatibacter sp.]